MLFVEPNNLLELEKRLNSIVERKFSAGSEIVVKLHMGELGNTTYLKPSFAKTIVKVLNDLNINSFLFDTPVCYSGKRETVEGYKEVAKLHKFTEENIGSPIIISNDSIKVEMKHLSIEVSTHIVKADGMIVLTHVKGHICSGFGGSIKNLGMGCLSKETKQAIHDGGSPLVGANCRNCGLCIKTCPMQAISFKDKLEVNYEKCCGCSICILRCPSKALKPKIALFDTLLAEGAYAVIKKQPNILYINVLQNISRLCDCAEHSSEIILDDIGILISDNIIEIDKHSLELINKKSGKNLFLELHNKDPFLHINEMEKLMKS